ncbi:MAG: hypothetical protein KatS3mg068_1997 [Candidatus Sericytochromatia bacterium]|nr:MAG: hypothetical protein KatS3mg068_1997 [Candidatus Sericytochromatia bacterium]
MKEFFDYKENTLLFINNLERVKYNVGGVSGSRGVTHTLYTTVRSFEELHQVTKGQGYQAVMTPEVFRALSRGQAVQIKIEQQAPERVNLLTPMVTAVMALLGGMAGAAYNEKLMNTIGNDIRKAAEFVSKYGINYQFGLGTGQHIERKVEFFLDDKKDNKENKPQEVTMNWRDWNYTTRPRPRALNTTIADNFDRRSDYQQVEYQPDNEEPYIPPYLDPLNLNQNPSNPPKIRVNWPNLNHTQTKPRGLDTTVTDNFDRKSDYKELDYQPDNPPSITISPLQPLNINQSPDKPPTIGDILDMRIFRNMTQKEGYLSIFNLDELKASGVLPPNATEKDIQGYVDRINSFFRSNNLPFQVKKQGNDYVIVDKNGKQVTKEAFAEDFLKKYGSATHGTNTSSGDRTITSRVVLETDIPETYKAVGRDVAQGKADAVTDYCRMTMTYGAFDSSNPENAFSIPKDGVIHTNQLKKWQQANQTFQDIENNIIDARMENLSKKDKELKLAYEKAFKDAYEKYKKMGLSDDVAKSRAKAEGIIAIGHKYIEQGRLLEGGKVFAAMVLKAEDHTGTYNGHIGAGHIGDVQGNNISEVNAKRRKQQTELAGGQQNFVPEANVYVDGARALSKLLSGQTLDTEEKNGLTNIVARYNKLTGAKPPLTVDQLKSEISLGNFSNVAKVLKFAKENLNEMKSILESTGYETAHPNLAILSMQLKEPNGILSQIDSLISYVEKQSVNNLKKMINSVNDASKAASLISRLAIGENLSKAEKDFLTIYTGRSIEDLSNPDVLKEELGKIRSKLQESVSKLPGSNQDAVKSLISNIDKLMSQIENNKDKIGKSSLSQRLDRIESRLEQFNDETILSDTGIEKLKEDLKSVDRRLQEELKKAGVNLDGYIKKDGTLDLDKLLADNKVPVHLKSDVYKFKKILDEANNIIQKSIDAKSAIPEYNESIAEDENFPQIKQRLEESGLDLSSLKTNGVLDSEKVFKLAAFLDDVKTGKKTLDQVPQQFRQIVSDLQNKPELKQELETLGRNVNVYQKDRTKEQEFIEVLRQYPGTKHSYDKLQGGEKLTGKSASGLDVYGIYTGNKTGLREAFKRLHEKGRPLSENDKDFKQVYDNVDGSVLIQNGKLTKDGEITRDFLMLAAKAGIIKQEELDLALRNNDGKALAQLFLKAELELHNRYGLKIDGQLGAEHMTDITHALRNKAQEYATMANLFIDFYCSGEIASKDMLIELILKNKNIFTGKIFDGIPFDEKNINEFLEKVLTSKKGAIEFLNFIKSQLNSIKDNIGSTGFKKYGQAAELMDDIDFVITGKNQKLGKNEENAGINAMISYIENTTNLSIASKHVDEAKIYVNATVAISKLMNREPLDKEEEEALISLVNRYNELTGTKPPLTVDQLKSEISSGNFSNVAKVLKFAKENLNEILVTLENKDYQKIHPDISVLSMQLKEPNGILSQIDSLISYLENSSVNETIKFVNDTSKAASLMSRIARGETLSENDKIFLQEYTGRSIEDLSNPDVLKEELGKIRSKLQESVSKLPGSNQDAVKSLISNIDKLMSQIENNKDKIGKSSLSQRLDRIESRLEQFNDETILSDTGIEKLKEDLKSVDRRLQEELKKAGVNLDGYIKKDGTLDLDKLLADNKVPVHLKSDVYKFKKILDEANNIIQKSIDAKSAIPEYNESIAEDENFPQIKQRLEESGLDLSSLKTNGVLDSEKVFKLAAFLDDVKTGKKTLDQVPQQFRQIVSDLQNKPELKQELETLGRNVNVYQKDRTKEQEFIEVLRQYPGTKHSYDKLQGGEKLTGKSASGLDVYGIYTGNKTGLREAFKRLHEKGRPLSENDKDFKQVYDNVDGSVLVLTDGKMISTKDGEMILTKDGEMIYHFLKLAAKAGIINQEELDLALKNNDGKALAQLFLKAELELHNRYGLKIDGQLGAEHMTDITHALRNKAQEYTTIANLFMDFYCSGVITSFDDSLSQLDGDETGKSNIDMLKELILKNKDIFAGKRFGDIPFDESNIDEFLRKILTSEKGATEFLEFIKTQLIGIRDTIGQTGFKEYGQAAELMDDIDFVITGKNEKLGKNEENAGIDAMIHYINETEGIGRKEGAEQTAEQYVAQISQAIDFLLQVDPNVPIKLGEHSFKNRNEALDFLYKEYQKVLLSGFPINNEDLNPEKMANKFTDAFAKTSRAYDDIRETISLLGEANNREINFKENNITVKNTPEAVMRKQINSLPETFEGSKEIKQLMQEVMQNSGKKDKVEELLKKMKEAFAKIPNDTRSDEIAKMYLAMAEKVIKKAEGKGPTDPPDFTDAFNRAKIPDSKGNVLSTSEALNVAIDTRYFLAKK